MKQRKKKKKNKNKKAKKYYVTELKVIFVSAYLYVRTCKCLCVRLCGFVSFDPLQVRVCVFVFAVRVYASLCVCVCIRLRVAVLYSKQQLLCHLRPQTNEKRNSNKINLFPYYYLT